MAASSATATTPTIAPRSAAIIFFPGAVERENSARFRYRFGWTMKKLFMVPTLSEGFLRFANQSNHSPAVEVSLPIHIKLPVSAVPYDVSFELANLPSQESFIKIILDGRDQEIRTRA